jgi:ketosteroid isomerase-like protein
MHVFLFIAMVIAPTGSATDEGKVRAAEERIFAAIMARDASALEGELAADFILSSPGKPDQARDDFLRAIASMPYRILEVGGEDIRCRLLGDVVVLSGVQRARVEIAPGNVVVARTAFADLFVREGDSWRLRHAFSVELPDVESE